MAVDDLLAKQELAGIVTMTLRTGTMKALHWKDLFQHVNGHQKAVNYMEPGEARNVLDFYETNRHQGA